MNRHCTQKIYKDKYLVLETKTAYPPAEIYWQMLF